jgi:hypothetical protein
VTVFGSTRNIVATSAGVSSDSASGVRVLATELLLVRPAFLADPSRKLVLANSRKTEAGRVTNLQTTRADNAPTPHFMWTYRHIKSTVKYCR